MDFGITCSCGRFYTITLSDDGTAHSFGKNNDGELGLGHNNDVSLPTPIPNLPKINLVSCGSYFTVCVDHEGFTWSFGKNGFGQLGTGNITNFNVPQKIQNIPPVHSVSCAESLTSSSRTGICFIHIHEPDSSHIDYLK